MLASHVAAAPARAKPRAKAHAAGDPGITIMDFKFSPATTTIHVGDTITWTNNDTSPHTATANNGSFDTGTLAKGASASHTFTHSGTFAYICSIHPYMHGTVVVLAAAKTPASGAPSTTTPAAASTTPTPTTAHAAAASHGPTLPVTGLAVPEIVAFGLALLALGWLVRRSAGAAS
ncbi:MAG: cupredoxin domain-containing protein [Solirubrobacteraceae bacterium]